MATTSQSNSLFPIAAAFLAGAGVAIVLGPIVSRRWTYPGRVRSVEDDASSSSSGTTPDEHLRNLVEHSFTAALIYVGDKLRLYDALADAGPSTAGELSERTGYSERWLAEWLSQSAAAGFCHYDGRSSRFSLRADYAPLLRDPDRERRSAAGLFQMTHGLVKRAAATAEAIRTGIGADYDIDGGDDLVHGIDRKNRNFFRYKFLEEVIEKAVSPSTGQSVVEMLERGVNAADVGCGCGTSTLVLAMRFPNSQFYAYEISRRQLDILKIRVADMNIPNITVCDVAERGVRDGPYFGEEGRDDNVFSFVYSHDVLHDMTDPVSLVRDVRHRLSKDGCWVIVDVECDANLAGNLAKKSAAINFGFSCLLCLLSSTSEEGGAGLGTVGFHDTLARKWMNENGFQKVQRIKIESLPDNSCFVVA